MLLLFGSIVSDNAFKSGCKTSKSLNFAGNDELGGPAVGGGGEGIQRADFEHALAGVGLVDELDGVGGGLLHLHDGLGLSFGGKDAGSLFGFGKDGYLLALQALAYKTNN